MGMSLEDQTRDAHYFAASISAQAGDYQRNAEVGQCSELDSAFPE